MINFILKNIIFKKRLKLIENKKVLYKSIKYKEDIQKYQIKEFNIIWSNAIVDIPFYKMWQKKYNLPNKINTLEELKQFPILTKKDIQENQDLIFNYLDNYSTVSTGGSTGEPTKFPVSKKESDFSYANHYLVRGWWNIKPLDNVVLFWGHSHLFGGGIKGKINQYKRVLSDWLINAKRLNAYDMSLDTLRKYYHELESSNPSMILGYTSTIYKMAKYIDENSLDIGIKNNLKGVVVTSETVTQYDIDLIERVFEVPCIIEYGMAETGVIAYSKNSSNNIKILWDSFIGIKDDENTLLITTISNKLFPLINYRTDDIIDTDDDLSILTINKINGRKNDFLIINNDNRDIQVHSEFFTHILKSIPDVINFQLKQKKDLSIEVNYVIVKNRDISKEFLNEIKKEFRNITDKQFTFKQVTDIPKTIAGKAKWIEKEI